MDQAEHVQSLFSEAVVAVESRNPEVNEALLWPEERAALGTVVDGRWWDWVTGRRCAREAMERLGVEPRPLLVGERREPLWPAEVVGAITHTRGYAAAAVALDRHRRSVGLDAEPDEPLPGRVLERIAHPGEVQWIESALADGPGAAGVENPDRLLFSIKESIYKAWYPLAGRWLGFDQAEVVIDASARSFEARILVDGPVTVVSGTYRGHDGIVMTGIEIAHD